MLRIRSTTTLSTLSRRTHLVLAYSFALISRMSRRGRFSFLGFKKQKQNMLQQ